MMETGQDWYLEKSKAYQMTDASFNEGSYYWSFSKQKWNIPEHLECPYQNTSPLAQLALTVFIYQRRIRPYLNQTRTIWI